MKIQMTISAAVASCLLMAAGGCSKEEESAVVPPPRTQEDASGVMQRAVATAEGQTKVVEQAAEGAVTDVQAQAAPATNKVQGIIDNAKKLIGESKWADALALLNSLNGQQLTPEQQSLLQSLKEQAQKAIQAAAATKTTDEAAKSVGGLLQPKQ